MPRQGNLFGSDAVSLVGESSLDEYWGRLDDVLIIRDDRRSSLPGGPRSSFRFCCRAASIFMFDVAGSIRNGQDAIQLLHRLDEA